MSPDYPRTSSKKVRESSTTKYPYSQPLHHEQQPPSPITRWMHIKKTIRENKKSLANNQKAKNDWFDDYDADINEALHGKREAFCRHMNTPTPENKLRYQKARNRAKRIIRDRKNRWWQNKAHEIKAVYYHGRSREYYMCIKLISSTLPRNPTAIYPIHTRPESSLKTNRTS